MNLRSDGGGGEAQYIDPWELSCTSPYDTKVVRDIYLPRCLLISHHESLIVRHPS